MKQFLYPVLSLITLVGCSKSKPEAAPTFDATGTFTVSATPEPGAVRMFTKAGEVQNAALIRKFSGLYPGLFFSPGPRSPFQTAELAFGSNSSATLVSSAWVTGNPVNSTTQLDITSQTNDQLVLTNKMLSGGLITLQNPDKCANIVRDIRGVSPVYTCTTLPPATGLGTRCDYKSVYVLNLHGTEARLATLSFIFSAAANGQACSFAYANDCNVFNTTLPSRLNVGDTLVVQETEYPLVRK